MIVQLIWAFQSADLLLNGWGFEAIDEPIRAIDEPIQAVC
jgi:hypothetical protein